MFCHGRFLCQTFHSHLKAKQYFSREVTGKQPSPLMQKIPASLPGLAAFKETLEWRSLYNLIFFFTSLLWKYLWHRLKGKKEKNNNNKRKKKQRKRKPALNEKFQSCFCRNPPSTSPLPLPLYPGLCFPAKGLESCWKTFSCCIETDIWQSSVVS